MVRSSAITETSVWTPKIMHVNLSYSSLQIYGITIWKEKILKIYWHNKYTCTGRNCAVSNCEH